MVPWYRHFMLKLTEIWQDLFVIAEWSPNRLRRGASNFSGILWRFLAIFVCYPRTYVKQTWFPLPETFRCDSFSLVLRVFFFYFFLFFHNSAGRKLDMIDIDVVFHPAKAPWSWLATLVARLLSWTWCTETRLRMQDTLEEKPFAISQFKDGEYVKTKPPWTTGKVLSRPEFFFFKFTLHPHSSISRKSFPLQKLELRGQRLKFTPREIYFPYFAWF